MADFDLPSTSTMCHLFLNYENDDTGKSFTAFLHRALEVAGFQTFLGGDINHNDADIERAVNQSMVSIIVFSKTYAKSSRSLDQLKKIIVHRENDPNHKVLPIFYDVQPTEVRHKTGCFQEAFTRHQQEFDADLVKAWREALKQVADVSGMCLQDDANGHQQKFVEQIVNEVTRKRKYKVGSLATYSVGLDSRAEAILKWLNDANENDIRTAVIYGVEGIGKTALARFVYNQNIDEFQKGSFVADINKASEHGLIKMQKQIVSDLTGKNQTIFCLEEGKDAIRRSLLCDKKVLLVLDGVDDSEQIEKLMGMNITRWLPMQSRIIITTREPCSLESCLGRFKEFQIRPLDEKESSQLFCRHAFGQQSPLGGYEDYIEPVVRHCRGLPAKLQGLGSDLFRKEVEVWKSILKKKGILS